VIIVTVVTINEERLLQSFMDWAKVDAPSMYEKHISELLVKELEGLGFSITFDNAHTNFGGEVGNLYAYWEGTDSDLEPIMFSTHMDTVLSTKYLKPVIRDGIIYSDGTTILGADDRAALASYIEAIKVIQEQNIPTGPIELVLTVNEQKGLTGSRYLELEKMKSRSGYVFDSSGDVGQIICQGPFSSKFSIDVYGKSSHIGLNPDEGNSAFKIASHIMLAIDTGQVDEQTLVNIGQIQGGELSSIIPGHVNFSGEIRAFAKDRHDSVLQEIFTIAEKVAKRENGTVDCKAEKKYSGFNLPEEHLLVKNAVNAAEHLKLDYYLTKTLGGADTNNLNELVVDVITLGNGFRNIHTFQEHISIQNLNDTARYTIGLVIEWYKQKS